MRKYMESACKAIMSLDEESVALTVEICVKAVSRGRTIFFCGNGGSAVDAQHLAGELVGRFRMERKALPAIALTANAAVMTAIANDYDFEKIFSRQVEALGKPGDVLVAISTSGNSPNVLRAVKKAVGIGMTVIGFTGSPGGKLAGAADVCVKVSSPLTSHVQEALLVVGHVLCEGIEKGCASPDGESG